MRLVLSAFKEARAAADLQQLIRSWGWLLQDLHREPDGGRAVQWILRYLYEVRGAEECRRIDLGKLIQTGESEKTMTFGDLMDSWEQRGLQRGEQMGQQAVFLRLLRRKFGELPDSLVARVEGADTASLERWVDRLLPARSVEEVFAD